MSPKRKEGTMRWTNWRLVIVGAALVGLAVVFYIVMLGMAGQSTDPQALMQTVGQTSGVVIGIGVAAAIIGYLGKKIG
jgi:predicted anti-sigma-YlaC factor YlaD